jgi:hypothetical protein
MLAGCVGAGSSGRRVVISALLKEMSTIVNCKCTAPALRAEIFKKSMGARHRGGIGFSYWPARLHRLAEFIPWLQFRGPIKHLKVRAQG